MNSADRLRSLDVTRFFAISMMFVAHWWGVLERFPGPHVDVLLWLCRAATPGFVTVFGLTTGYVFWHMHLSNPGALRARIRARTLKTAGYALLVSIPGLATLAYQGKFAPSQWVFETYSVLAFYTLAIPSILVILPLVRSRPMVLAPVTAVGLWIAGELLRRVWPAGTLTWIEYPRLLLVSGPYAYFNLMAIAVAVMPAGVFLRREMGRRQRAGSMLGVIAAAGAAISVVALVAGVSSDGFTARDVLTGAARYPPRVWYFSHFAGLTLFVFGAFGMLEASARGLPRWLRPLGTIGRWPLQVYAAHAFVLPVTRLLAWVSGLRTEVTFTLVFLVFVGYCAWLARPRHPAPSAIAKPAC